MDWNLITQISTAIGAIIGAASLIAVYRIYYTSKRDDFVKNLRMSLSQINSSCLKLNQLATHELMHEISYSVTYRDDVRSMLNDLIEKIENEEDKDKFLNDKESLKSFIDENIPAITFPIKSALIKEYENHIEKSKSSIMQYRFDYPGLYRVTTSVLEVFQNLSNSNKSILYNDELWNDLLTEILFDAKLCLLPANLLNKLHANLVGILLYKFKEAKDQDDINDMIAIANLTIGAYLRLEDKELFSLSKNEKSIKLQQENEILYITDDLLEVQKTLRMVLTEEELLNYRGFVSAFYERNKPDEEE